MNKQTTFSYGGVFIPAHIWANPRVCYLDKMVWGLVDTWHDGDHMCSASDQQIGDWLGENEMMVSASVLRLCQNDLIHTTVNEHGDRLLWTVTIVYIERETPKEAEASMPDVQRVVDIYNECCKSLPRAEKLTPTRVSRVRALLKKNDEQWFKFLFLRVQASTFLTGQSGRWTGCNLDWILIPANLTKITEGVYDSRAVSAPRQLPENLR